MECRIVSQMEKLFSDTSALPREITELYLLRGEVGGAELAFFSETEVRIAVHAESPLPLELYLAQEIPAGFAISEKAKNCTLLREGKPGRYPDLLRPFGGSLHLAAGETKAVFVRVLTADAAPGDYTLRFTAACGNRQTEMALRAHVSSAALPEQALIHTDWFHADCLSAYYGVEAWSEAHWRIVERFMENAAAYGVNCLLTPLFTPPLDTAVGGERPTVQLVDVARDGQTFTFGFDRLFRWITLARKHGVRYFEFSHFFTQWGAKHAPKVIARTKTGVRRIFGWETNALSGSYLRFLEQLGKALLAFTDSLGITDRCFVHCSDEPGMGDLKQYQWASRAVRSFFPAYRQLDALSDFEFYRLGLVETPVPEEGSIEKFRGKTPKLWTYYCCGQYNNELPNRFFAMPAARSRILGALLYQYDCEGFLHWGYNFYFTQYSLRLVDPFTETDAGGAFPSGDSFIVYPGEDGAPLTSLRQQAFFAGLQDLRALRAAEAKTDRETVLRLLRETLGEIDFSHYPMDPMAFEKMRKALFELVG